MGRRVKNLEHSTVERHAVIRQYMLAGYTGDRIVEICGERYGWTLGQVRATYATICDEWTKQSEDELQHARAQAIQRIRFDLAKMREAVHSPPPRGRGKGRKKGGKDAPESEERIPTFKDIAAHEMLLARIEGTLRPIEVKVDIRAVSRRALIDVIQGMAPEEMDALVIEQREIERKALGSGK